MPEGPEHKDFCQRWILEPHRYDSGCPLGLYRIKCPLDILRRANGEDWHSVHSVKRVMGYSQIERPQQTEGCVTWPATDDCVAWVHKALNKMEPYFDEFCSQLANVSREEVRLCWMAHLVADFACDYCYVATGQKGKYRHIKKDYPSFWTLFCNFVTDVRKRIPLGQPTDP